jgi:chromosome segregation ATPase
MRRIEEKLTGKERTINTMEVMLATSEENVRKLEKQLSAYEGEEKLAVELREKEELIKQLKGPLASKEEAFSRVNEENRKYRMQQKFASDGLRQIEEQKASRKWWKRFKQENQILGFVYSRPGPTP